MRVGARYGLLVKIERARYEAANQDATRLEGGVRGRRQVHLADFGLEGVDRKRERIQAAVPSDDVEWRRRQLVLLQRAAGFEPKIAEFFVARGRQDRPAKIAM